ncbi:MAG: VOC family protein [Pseudomonadota bacterium]
MLSYITLGADDLDVAKRFYSTFLPALGYELTESKEGLSYVIPAQQGQRPNLPELYVVAPFDGRAATAGNGTMIAFDAKNQRTVKALHAAALAAGGQDEGPPGFREAYGPRFFVGYLRDPHGNKIALYSSNPDDPERGE